MNTRLWLLTTALVTATVILVGCTCPPKPVEPKPTACAPSGSVYSKMEFPACNKVLVEKSGPKQVIAGVDFNYTITVSNKNRAAVSDVVLTETLPANLRFKSAKPMPTSSGSVLSWNLGQMAPGSSHVIVITGSAIKTGDLYTCSEVTTKPDTMCLTMAAIEPRLDVALVGPADTVLCDPVTYKITVKNVGTGPACNVKVKDVLPAGMKGLDGTASYEKSFGSLAPGESREMTIDARVEKTGRYANRATAWADGGLMASSSEVSTLFRTPALVVTKSGPNMEYIGKELTYMITVANTGDAVSKNTILTEQLGRGTQFKSATGGGKMSSPVVSWNLGDIAPGDKKTVEVTVIPSEKGNITSMSVAKAYCAENSASATTMVKGIPAILLECVDIEDPIRINSNVTYEIRVTNQGSAEGTNIVIKCELPAELSFVSADGPAASSVQDRQIVFSALPKLDPGKTVVYKVTAKGLQAGDVRFMVNLTSDQMTSPAMETESTHIY